MRARMIRASRSSDEAALDCSPNAPPVHAFASNANACTGDRDFAPAVVGECCDDYVSTRLGGEVDGAPH
jgi:hypothetical protein